MTCRRDTSQEPLENIALLRPRRGRGCFLLVQFWGEHHYKKGLLAGLICREAHVNMF